LIFKSNLVIINDLIYTIATHWVNNKFYNVNFNIQNLEFKIKKLNLN